MFILLEGFHIWNKKHQLEKKHKLQVGLCSQSVIAYRNNISAF